MILLVVPFDEIGKISKIRLTAQSEKVNVLLKMFKEGKHAEILADSRGFVTLNNGIAKIGNRIGNLGILIKHPGISIDWTKYSSHGFERMTERGVTREMAETWVKIGKVIQQDVDTYLFLTKEGVAVVSKDGKLITAYTKNEFKDHIIKAIELIYGK